MIYANIHSDGRYNNSLFELEDAVHRFNPSYTPRLLREEFLKRGIELNTPDINSDRPVRFDIHLEGRLLSESSRPKYLIALENPNINKLNANINYYSNFELAFTWDSRLYHLANVVPILIPHPMMWQDFTGPENRRIFSCLINANKAFKEVLDSDLYQERLKVIRWYEQHAPNQFDLYGLGWDKPPPAYTFATRVPRTLSRIKTKLLGTAPFPSYRGEIQEKATVLRQSRFSYCYENNRDITNYITEKMLDSLVNGCVPIYWGADNVTDHVPAECFVDRRQFKDTASVHQHLLDISNDRYLQYQMAIRNFLQSESAKNFSSAHFVQIIVDQVCVDLKHADLL